MEHPTPTPLRVLLVEDDEGDAVLVRELLTEAVEPVVLTWARSLAEAERMWAPSTDCVLLDLALPDADGLDGLARLRDRGVGAVVVLTGLADRAQGLAAVVAGAQDYLLKGQIEAGGLERALRYAAQRHRTDRVSQELVAARLLAEENTRLSRGLLPAPLLRDPAVGYAAQYLPGGGRLLLGGDFYDVVQTPDDMIWVLIGDVCGHGPDEAALGVALRIAWRTLVLAGHPAQAILPTLQQLLIHERHRPFLFATAAMVCIAADRCSAQVWTAGHPAPLLRIGPGPWFEQPVRRELPLGVDPDQVWSAGTVDLGLVWELLLYTDGLIEGRAEPAADALWVDGLLGVLDSPPVVAATGPHQLVQALTGAVNGLAPGHDDDVAVILLTYPATPARPAHPATLTRPAMLTHSPTPAGR